MVWWFAGGYLAMVALNLIWNEYKWAKDQESRFKG